MKPIGFLCKYLTENVAGTAYAVPVTFPVKYLQRKHIGLILL